MEWRRIVEEGRRTLRLAGPLMANNVATTGMGFVDTVMAGRLGALDLAAIAVGSAVWFMAFLFGLGTLMAVNPITAHNVGAGTPERVGAYVRQALWLSLALALILISALTFSERLLDAAGVAADIVPVTGGYVRALCFGLPLALAYLSLRFMSEGIGHTRPIMYMAIVGLSMNVLGNYALMFGNFGFPALGAFGCGIATAAAFATMFLGMLIYVSRHRIYRPLGLFERFELPVGSRIREILALGLPIGGSILAEAGLFSAVGIIMGTLGTATVAAHQIAINYAATMFMLPLAVASAITVRVGQAMGAGDPASARLRGYVGVGICAGIMAISAIIMLLFSAQIVGFYTPDETVQHIAIGLLGMAAIFQVSDGVQVGGAGALRGIKDTHIPMLINVFSYWAVGFPLAYFLGVRLGMGPQWVWFGFVAGLSVSALLLNGRFMLMSGRKVRAAIANDGALKEESS